MSTEAGFTFSFTALVVEYGVCSFSCGREPWLSSEFAIFTMCEGILAGVSQLGDQDDKYHETSDGRLHKCQAALT